MKPVPLDQVAAEAPPDWLDDVLAAQAAHTRPADAGFSAAVVAALPRAHRAQRTPQALRAAAWLRMGSAVAAGLCAAAIAALAPQALDLLAATAHPGAWLAPSVLQALLPPAALAAWLAWWSVRQAAGNR
jgi:hypothetical protein